MRINMKLTVTQVFDSLLDCSVKRIRLSLVAENEASGSFFALPGTDILIHISIRLMYFV